MRRTDEDFDPNIIIPSDIARPLVISSHAPLITMVVGQGLLGSHEINTPGAFHGSIHGSSNDSRILHVTPGTKKTRSNHPS